MRENDAVRYFNSNLLGSLFSAGAQDVSLIKTCARIDSNVSLAETELYRCLEICIEVMGSWALALGKSIQSNNGVFLELDISDRHSRKTIREENIRFYENTKFLFY